MPVGSGAQLMSNLPAQPYDINPALFFKLTSKTHTTPTSFSYPGAGTRRSIELPHAGILSEIRVLFEGNIAGAAAGVEDPLWAYRLIRDVRFSGSGQTDLISCLGIDLHVMRFIKNAALQRPTEFYSSAPDENGNFRAVWVVPVASDPTTLIGAVWAQSQASQLTLDLTFESLANLGLTGATVTGTVYITETWFDPPFDPAGSGKLIIPDLRRTHGIITRDQSFSSTGVVNASLARQQATLMRLLSYIDLGAAAGTPNPVDYTKATPDISAHEFEYGAIQTPYEFRPAWELAAINSEHYGSPLPKGYVCLDLVKENPPRDSVVMPGITDPRWNSEVVAGTVLANGSKVHLVEELLYTAAAA